MPGLRLKMRFTILMVFHSFIDDVCYAVAFLHCRVSLSESKLMVWYPFLRVQVFVDFFSISFIYLSSNFETVGSKLIDR
jgi:hypothetical protein